MNTIIRYFVNDLHICSCPDCYHRTPSMVKTIMMATISEYKDAIIELGFMRYGRFWYCPHVSRTGPEHTDELVSNDEPPRYIGAEMTDVEHIHRWREVPSEITGATTKTERCDCGYVRIELPSDATIGLHYVHSAPVPKDATS